MNIVMVFVIVDFFLLVIKVIGGKEVKDGIVGVDYIYFIDIMVFFIIFVYIVIFIDVLGFI